jgi:hypothetical protein
MRVCQSLAIYSESLSRADPECGTARPGTRPRPSHTVSNRRLTAISDALQRPHSWSSLLPPREQLLPTVLCSCVLLDCVRSSRAAGSTNHGSACGQMERRQGEVGQIAEGVGSGGVAADHSGRYTPRGTDVHRLGCSTHEFKSTSPGDRVWRRGGCGRGPARDEKLGSKSERASWVAG